MFTGDSSDIIYEHSDDIDYILSDSDGNDDIRKINPVSNNNKKHCLFKADIVSLLSSDIQPNNCLL